MTDKFRFNCLMLLASGVLWFSGCDLPTDPEQTTERVQGNVMRVGILQAPPWANVSNNDTPTGVEFKLVQLLAKELDAQVQWFPSGDTQLMSALEQFDLELVIGGISDDTPWGDRVALSGPYITTMASQSPTGQDKREPREVNHVFGLPPGENRWLMLVDDFLMRHRHTAAELLEQEQSAPVVFQGAKR